MCSFNEHENCLSVSVKHFKVEEVEYAHLTVKLKVAGLSGANRRLKKYLSVYTAKNKYLSEDGLCSEKR